jgi:hypothetical protein
MRIVQTLEPDLAFRETHVLGSENQAVLKMKPGFFTFYSGGYKGPFEGDDGDPVSRIADPMDA